MRHEDIQDRLLELHDGELKAEEEAELRAHLDSCAECRLAHQRWGRIARALFAAPPPEPSPAFARRLLARLEELPQEGARGLRREAALLWRLPAWGLALAALLFALSLAREGQAFPPLSTETLLLADAGEAASPEWLLAPVAPDAGEVLGFALEAP